MSRVARRLCLCTLLVSLVSQAADESRLELLSKLVRDPSPQVRVEALRALATVPSGRSAELALSVLSMPMDPTLDYALWLTINDLSEPWIEAVTSGAWKPEGRERELEFALRSLKPEQVSRVLAKVLGDRPLPADGAGPWIEIIGAAGAPRELGRLLAQAAAGGFQPAATERALKALAVAARNRQQKPEGDRARLVEFLRNPSPGVRREAAVLAGLWKDVPGTVPVLMNEVVGGAASTPEERTAAFDALRQIGGDPVTDGLRQLTANAATAPEVRRGAAVALAGLDLTGGVQAAVDAARTAGTEASALELWRDLLGVKGSALPLREALSGQSLPEVAARAGMRVAREGGRDDIELVAAFAKAGGLAQDSQELTRELIAELAAKALAEGNPQKGERVYRRAELACVTCHAIGGVGGKVGPDMTSLGASAPMDYLVEALLLPSAKIKEGYHSVVVETSDGEEVTGTLARETQQDLVLRNVAGQEVTVPKSTIARREMGRLSLMPAGLLEPLSEGDRLDLFAFLGRLGKPGEFDASRGGVARVWHAANVVHTDLQNEQADWFWKAPFTNDRWARVPALVSGSVSDDLLNAALKAQAWTSKVALVFATELNQSAAGNLTFRFQPAEAELWIDGKRVGTGPEVKATVPAGKHRVVLRADPRRTPSVVRLEADGAVFVLE